MEDLFYYAVLCAPAEMGGRNLAGKLEQNQGRAKKERRETKEKAQKANPSSASRKPSKKNKKPERTGGNQIDETYFGF